MAYRLISTEGDQSFELRLGTQLILGRALNSDIPVLDPTISRRHAEIVCDGEGIEVRDLGSSNGTFLNGDKVAITRVSAGDLVTFGKVAFRVKEVAASFETPALPTPAAMRPGSTIVRQVRVPNTSEGFAAALRASSSLPMASHTPDTPVSERERNQQKLELLLQVSQGLTRTTSIDALLEKIVDFSFQIFDGDRVSTLMADDRGELVPSISRDKQGTEAGRTVPSSIARRVVEEKLAILSDNAPEDARFGGQSILVQRVRSAMAAPLIGSEGRVLGLLYVDNLTTTNRFTEEDLEFLVAFAGIAAVAIENSQFSERIRREMIVRNNFERYFAPSLAARIANSPEAARLGGEKRTVAVLFSDIRGFTALSESMMPDDMANLLTEYFTEMVDVVFRHGGTLDKFIGDAVMAQWGAPIGSPDDADRAMAAAIDMIVELGKLNVKWREQGRPELQIGIGLNHGEAFAGNIGSERRLEFTVIGDTVNTASRLCSAADGGEILLSDEFRLALSDPPKMKKRPAMQLKGKGQPVPVYRVKP